MSEGQLTNAPFLDKLAAKKSNAKPNPADESRYEITGYPRLHYDLRYNSYDGPLSSDISPVAARWVRKIFPTLFSFSGDANDVCQVPVFTFDHYLFSSGGHAEIRTGHRALVC